ncbi:MAG: hypothetical protein BGO95_06885 [Micrococcales bacterium 73-13]|nr:MAG: hypothetical protein BGO95_06885 [Micrococcales bacterium 73-13]
MSKRTGERCKRYCALGQVTCNMHGANGRSKAKAAKVIAGASGYAAEMLVEFMADPAVPVKDRTQIAQDLLNRANVVGKTNIELDARMQTWQRVLIESLGDESEDDLSVPLPPRAELPVLEAEVVEEAADAASEAAGKERAKHASEARAQRAADSARREVHRRREGLLRERLGVDDSAKSGGVVLRPANGGRR